MSRRKDTGFTKESHVSGLNACLVVAATTFNYFLVGAVQYSQGLMFREFLDEFRAGKLTTSWLCGLLLGLMNLSAMFTCWLDGLVSYRTMSLVGSVLICCGMVGSSFVSNINILFFTYGTLIGFGGGLLQVPSLLISQLWFEKRRALAIAITVSGSPFGSFIYCPLLQFLFDTFGWRGALQISGAIYLNGCAAGLLFVPPKSSKPQKHENTSSKESIDVPQPDELLNSEIQIVQPNLLRTIKLRLQETFNPKLVKSSELYMVCLHFLFYCLAFPVFTTFLPIVASSYHINEETVAQLLSIYGFVECSGRLVYGLIANSRKIHSVYLWITCTCLGGVSLVALTWAKSMPLIYIFTILIAFNTGGFFTCLSVVIVDLFQKEFISSVWVFAHLAQTLSFLTSSYIHAKFSEATGKPQMALLLAGLFECTGGFLHLFYFVFVYRRRKKRSTSK